MNDEPNPPPQPSLLQSAAQFDWRQIKWPQLSDLKTTLEQVRTHSQWVQYAGAALIVLSFPFMWWSLTRYRIYEQRGVDMGSAEQVSAIEKNMDEDDKKDYHERIGVYARAWALNSARFEEFYYDYLGEDYAKRLNDEIAYSKRSGTLGLRGWSTWTAWFGLTFVVLLFASQYAAKFMEDFEPIAWGFPWAAALVFGFFTIMALTFFISVPGANDDGIAQGVGLGNYLAMFGGLLVTTGSVFEGIKVMNARLAELEAAGDDDADDGEPEAEPAPKPKKPAAPMLPKKSRLEDW